MNATEIIAIKLLILAQENVTNVLLKRKCLNVILMIMEMKLLVMVIVSLDLTVSYLMSCHEIDDVIMLLDFISLPR